MDLDAGIVDTIGSRASTVGHLNSVADVDGAIRTEPLVLSHFDAVFPSLSLMVAAKSLNLTGKDIQVRFGEGV
ncbi:MAG TPA: hypothetical protein PKC22_12815, partial [Rhodocyclaceae bacterium]|nr:hypothetical protein [Rhodocyclaceae bacterium]